jgi:hypothetical protein
MAAFMHPHYIIQFVLLLALLSFTNTRYLPNGSILDVKVEIFRPLEPDLKQQPYSRAFYIFKYVLFVILLNLNCLSNWGQLFRGEEHSDLLKHIHLTIQDVNSKALKVRLEADADSVDLTPAQLEDKSLGILCP